MTADELDRLAASLRAGDYNLLLGAAASLGSKNAAGEDIPLADAYRQELCALKSAKGSHSLQRIFQVLDEAEIAKHVTARFSGCVPGPALKAVPRFIWKRIFTLNIDDALEAAYSEADRYQTPSSKNFRDTYEDVRDNSSVPIIHLHGFSRLPKDGYIFSREAYLQIIKSSNPWMVILSQLIASEPFIIMGSSLDEVDLDYFLSLRSQSSARADRGPSILIEPFGDIITDRECERLGLLKFDGTSEEFMAFLEEKVKDRPRPHELVPIDARSIFVDEPTTHDVSSFYSDFEKVPAAVVVNTHDPRFFFGHAPTWSDLSLHYDISRPVTNALLSAINDSFSGKIKSKVVFLSDHVGVGKSTVLRRLAFDFARQGMNVLSCSAISRLEPRFTASMLNNIAGRLLIIVDDFADQVYSIHAILQVLEKEDVVFLASERSYRHRFVTEVLGSVRTKTERSTSLSEREAEQLVDTFIAAGLVGSEAFIHDKDRAVKALTGEPIAVACCRILNDLRPLDRIVDSLLTVGNRVERLRYLTAALAQFCTKSGVRHDLLVAATSGAGISGQFNAIHPLPLTYSEETGRNYVIPLNGTLATRVLEVIAERHPDDMFQVFENLGKAIAPRVTRKTIVQRTPEARLAARLFDLDQVVERFLGQRASDFYEAVETEWRWNSRYWEQIALLNLYRSQAANVTADESEDALNLAIGHARHAVSIERHPLTLTTLTKILFAEAAVRRDASEVLLAEALASVNEAIGIERRRDRLSVHPYVVLFQGIKALPLGVSLKETDAALLGAHLRDAERLFPRDEEVRSLVGELKLRLTPK